MKISEFLQDLFKITGPTLNVSVDGSYMLTPEMLKIPIIKDGLLKCEEFENTKELIIMDAPSIEIEVENGKTKKNDSATMLLMEGIKFKEKVYLYSISLTPTIWEVEDYMKPVKDDVCVTPPICDPIYFTPRRGVTVFFSPEALQDSSAAGAFEEESFRDALIEKFKKALNNPKEYTPKEKKVVMIRGLMGESIESQKEDGFWLSDGPMNKFVSTTPIPKRQIVIL